MKRYLLVFLLAGCAFTNTESEGAKEPAEPAGKNPVVVMKTSMGTVKIELFQDKSPITAKNFLRYVDDKHYDGTVFHRVIESFMIQGGGFPKGFKDIKTIKEFRDSEKKTREPIKNESSNGVSNKRGTLAMARTNAPDSATAQFFINVVDNARLDGRGGRAGYAVFGRVVEGMEVVDKIRKVKTKRLPFHDEEEDPSVPVEDVVIESVRRAAE